MVGLLIFSFLLHALLLVVSVGFSVFPVSVYFVSWLGFESLPFPCFFLCFVHSCTYLCLAGLGLATTVPAIFLCTYCNYIHVLYVYIEFGFPVSLHLFGLIFDHSCLWVCLCMVFPFLPVVLFVALSLCPHPHICPYAGIAGRDVLASTSLIHLVYIFVNIY
jgi:hypothetical protein